jgi:hypothetical protein
MLFSGPISANTTFWTNDGRKLNRLADSNATHIDLALDDQPTQPFEVLLRDCKDAMEPFGECLTKKVLVQPMEPLKIIEWTLQQNGTGQVIFSHHVQSWNSKDLSLDDFDIYESFEELQCSLPIPLESTALTAQENYNCSESKRRHVPVLMVEKLSDTPGIGRSVYKILTKAYNMTEDGEWTGAVKVRDPRFPKEKLVLFDWITPLINATTSDDEKGTGEPLIEFSIFKGLLLGFATFAYVFVGGCLLSLVHYLFDLSVDEFRKVTKAKKSQ